MRYNYDRCLTLLTAELIIKVGEAPSGVSTWAERAENNAENPKS